MPFLDVPNGKEGTTRLYYEVNGTGIPILLIHGWLCNSTFWDDFKVLAKTNKYMVITLDLRGHGESDYASDMTIQTLANDVKFFLDFLKIEKAIIIGHSMGGLVAQTFYADNPDRVIALGLWDTGAKIPFGYGIGTFFYVFRIVAFILGLILTYPIGGLFRFVLTQGWKLAFAKKGKSEAYIRYVPSVKQLKKKAVMKAAFALAGFDGRKKLKDINVPVMLLHGVKDRNITPRQLFEYFKKNIKEYIAYTCENAGHFPPNESFDEVYEYLNEFLEILAKKSII
jgi:pimeloyl-ACP methyl ester carboxylesterase